MTVPWTRTGSLLIMNGLKEDLSMEVIKADPQTLEDVCNIASRAEMAGRCRSPLIKLF